MHSIIMSSALLNKLVFMKCYNLPCHLLLLKSLNKGPVNSFNHCFKTLLLRLISALHTSTCVLQWDRPCLSLFLSVWTRVSVSVKHRWLAPLPLHFHNIRYSVTVCCGLRTLITWQENNVDGKAVQHLLRSLSPPRTCMLIKWLYSADQKRGLGTH